MSVRRAVLPMLSATALIAALLLLGLWSDAPEPSVGGHPGAHPVLVTPPREGVAATEMLVERHAVAVTPEAPNASTTALPSEVSGRVSYSNGKPVALGVLSLVPFEAAVDTGSERIESAAYNVHLDDSGGFSQALGADWTFCRNVWITVHDRDLRFLDQRQIQLAPWIEITVPSRNDPEWGIEGSMRIVAPPDVALSGRIELWDEFNRQVCADGQWSHNPISVATVLSFRRPKTAAPGAVSLRVYREGRLPLARVDAASIGALEHMLRVGVTCFVHEVMLSFDNIRGRRVARMNLFWSDDWYRPQADSIPVSDDYRWLAPNGRFLCATEDDRLTIKGVSRFSISDEVTALRVTPAVVLPGACSLSVECQDSNGELLAYAPVRCVLLDHGESGAHSLYSAVKYTEADGRVEFGAMPAGSYEVWAAKPGQGEVRSAVQTVALSSSEPHQQVRLLVAELTCVYFEPLFANPVQPLPRGGMTGFWRRLDRATNTGRYRGFKVGAALLDSALRGLAPGDYEFVLVADRLLGRVETSVAASSSPQKIVVPMEEQPWVEGRLASVRSGESEPADDFDSLEVWPLAAGDEPDPWLVGEVDHGGEFRLMVGGRVGALRVMRRQSDSIADVSAGYRIELR